ncbi:S8 family peptidase [Natrialbaceae archaeon A-gly3]
MSRQTRRRFLGGVAATGIAITAIATVSANGRTRYLVTASGGGVRTRLEREGFDVEDELAGGDVFVVLGPGDSADDLESVRGVRAAAADVRFSVDLPVLTEVPDASILEGDEKAEPTLWELQWDKQVQNVLEAHEHATGDGTTLAIIDTGIDPDHLDLEPNLDKEASRLFQMGETIEEGEPVDPHGHGTHVAGTAAATGEQGAIGTGIVGTAPDATLVSARVFWFDEEDGEVVLTTTTADILRAIDYAAEIGADAANMSIGTPPLPPEINAAGIRVAYERMIQHATSQGTVVVASAGNSDANLQQGGYFTVPNSTAGAMSISATAPNDLRTFYSNYGTNEIDVGAPGGGYETLEKTLAEDTEWPYPTNLVLSSVPEDVYDAPYAYFAGTSMAAPQVTGLAGLVRQLEPHANANQVESAIKHGAESATGRSDTDLGAGRVNALETVKRL